MINTNLFKSRLYAAGLTINKLAALLGVHPLTLYKKINGRAFFTVPEVLICRDAMALAPDELIAIFFTS